MRRWPDPGAEYLEVSSRTTVRFQETDAMGVVWHGHYLSYFEDGRAEVGRLHGMSYLDVASAGLLIPVVHVQIDYAAPARFGDTVTVRTRLHPDAAARLQFTYLISGSSGERLAEGRTVQLFTDAGGKPLMTRPPIYEEFLASLAGQLRSA